MTRLIMAWLLKKKKMDERMWSKGMHGPDVWSNAVGVGRCTMVDEILNVDYDTIVGDLDEE